MQQHRQASVNFGIRTRVVPCNGASLAGFEGPGASQVTDHVRLRHLGCARWCHVARRVDMTRLERPCATGDSDCGTTPMRCNSFMHSHVPAMKHEKPAQCFSAVRAPSTSAEVEPSTPLSIILSLRGRRPGHPGKVRGNKHEKLLHRADLHSERSDQSATGCIRMSAASRQ